jgi:hypothetical protein
MRREDDRQADSSVWREDRLAPECVLPSREIPMPISDRSFKRLTLENVNRAPRKRGVYALYVERTLVFLGHAGGAADTIRSRLRAHLRAKPAAGTRYKREPAPKPQERLQTLLREYVARHGSLPARNAAGA